MTTQPWAGAPYRVPPSGVDRTQQLITTSHRPWRRIHTSMTSSYRLPVSRRSLITATGMLVFAGCSPRLPPRDSGADAGAKGTRRTALTSPQFYVRKGPRDIALTFDDGPHPQWTPAALSMLRRLDIRATFFLIGSQVDAHPDLARAIAADGHVLANHTWSHADLAKTTSDTTHAQIARASDAIEKACGSRPAMFRSPYGVWSERVLVTCAAMDLRPVAWSVDPKDWARPAAEQITTRVLAQTHPGSIILTHDGGGNRSQTISALRDVLPRLRDKGYTFVTL